MTVDELCRPKIKDRNEKEIQLLLRNKRRTTPKRND